jgi:hypothetical protein
VPAPTTPNPDVDPDSLPYTNAVLAMLLPATAQATLPPILARWGGSNVHADLTGTADSPRLLPAPAWPRGCFQRQLGPAAASSASLAPGQICGSGSRQVHGSVEPFAEAVHKEEDGNPGDMPGDEGDSEDSEPLLMTVSLGEMQTCACEHVKVEHLFTIPGEEFPRCHECVKPFRGKKATHKKAPPVLVLLHVQDEAASNAWRALPAAHQPGRPSCGAAGPPAAQHGPPAARQPGRPSGSAACPPAAQHAGWGHGGSYTEAEWDEWRAWRSSEWAAARAAVAAAGGGGAAPAPTAPAPAGGGGLANQTPHHLTRPQCPAPRRRR